MKINYSKYIKQLLAMMAGIALLASCNKDVPDATPITPSARSGQTLAALINNDANFSILKAAIAKASTSTASPSISALLADSTAVYTFFAPTDLAFQTSFQLLGIPQNIGIAAFRPGQLDTILRAHIVGGQALTGNAITSSFPNAQLPTLFSLAPPSASLPPGLRMPVFASKRGGNYWVNNIPLTGVDVLASNGVLHKTGLVVAPPSDFLWNRIVNDPNLDYLEAAIKRADEGVAPVSTLQAALLNPAANLTVFAPTNTAFQQLLTAQITAVLMAPPYNLPQAQAQAAAMQKASTTGVFTDPQLASVLTPTNVKGLVAYHLLGSRAFTNNLPTTATAYPTLLNLAVSTHPGVTVQATFGATGVTAATVKGVFNQTASNIQINPMPGTGTSDQHYINGVLHIIDQVLRPQ